MSTKTIALESSIYDKLARLKQPSESFTKTINRLIESASETSCAAAVASAAEVWKRIGDEREADRMEDILRETRERTDWSVERPA